MGEIQQQRAVLLIAAVSSRYESAIDDWFAKIATSQWGPIALQSPMFEFTETTYYEPSMGTGLKKKFFAFENLIDAADISGSKIVSNQWEKEYQSGHKHDETRPLNIDPGYITEAKLVLATTKDRDHRIYLRDGIFAEITLYFRQGIWEKSRWTYPDYMRDDFHAFFDECRQYLRDRYCE